MTSLNRRRVAARQRLTDLAENGGTLRFDGLAATPSPRDFPHSRRKAPHRLSPRRVVHITHGAILLGANGSQIAQ